MAAHVEMVHSSFSLLVFYGIPATSMFICGLPRFTSRDRFFGGEAGKERQGIVTLNGSSRLLVESLIALKPQEREGGNGLACPGIISAKEQLRRLNQGLSRCMVCIVPCCIQELPR